jgi:hypothetical protein
VERGAAPAQEAEQPTDVERSSRLVYAGERLEAVDHVAEQEQADRRGEEPERMGPWSGQQHDSRDHGEDEQVHHRVGRSDDGGDQVQGRVRDRWLDQEHPTQDPGADGDDRGVDPDLAIATCCPVTEERQDAEPHHPVRSQVNTIGE